MPVDKTESVDYNNLKIVNTFIKNGVKYILKGDKSAANSLIVEGVKQSEILSLYNTLDIAKRVTYVDSNNTIARITVTFLNDIKTVEIAVPPLKVSEVITSVGEIVDKDYEWYEYPAIAFKFIGEDYYDVTLWWCTDGLKWMKPAYTKKIVSDDKDLFIYEASKVANGKVSKFITKMEEIGYHDVDSFYDGDATREVGDWVPGEIDVPDMWDLTGNNNLIGPNLAGSYLDLTVQTCLVPCPDVPEWCFIYRDQDVYGWLDLAGNQVSDPNQSRCSYELYGALFALVFWRGEGSIIEHNCSILPGGIATHFPIGNGEWQYPPGGVQRKSGSSWSWGKSYLALPSGKEVVSSSITDSGEWTVWIEGIYSGESNYEGSMVRSGSYLSVVSSDDYDTMDYETSYGYGGVVVRDHDKYADESVWAVIYGIEDVSYEKVLAKSLSDCSDNIGELDWEEPKVNRRYYIETNDSKFFLGEKLLSFT